MHISDVRDSRIGILCDSYCDTSALAEVSTCWRKLTGHWVGSGIVVSIKGGGARRMHGRGQGCLPAAACEGCSGAGGAVQPLSRQFQGDDPRVIESWSEGTATA